MSHRDDTGGSSGDRQEIVSSASGLGGGMKKEVITMARKYTLHNGFHLADRALWRSAPLPRRAELRLPASPEGRAPPRLSGLLPPPSPAPRTPPRAALAGERSRDQPPQPPLSPPRPSPPARSGRSRRPVAPAR